MLSVGGMGTLINCWWQREMAEPIGKRVRRFLKKLIIQLSWGFPDGRGKDSACNSGDLGLIPGSGRFPGEGNGYPLQYSCLQNSTDRGASWAIVHSITKELDTTKCLHNTHHEPAMPLQDIHPREMAVHVHAETHMQMFTAALFLNRPKLETTYMSANKWEDKFDIPTKIKGIISIMAVVLQLYTCWNSSRSTR